MQTIEAALPVEGHAERPPADMGVDFPLDVIGREEADDLALPDAAIEMVVLIENDVLGTVNLAEADDLHLAKAVVHRVGRRERRRNRGAGGQGEIGRRHIDFGAQAMPPLAPSDVDGDGEQEHEADHHRGGAVFKPKTDEPIRQQRNDDRAHQGLADRAAAAADAVAAKNRRRHAGEFEADAGVGTGAGKPRSIERAGEARQHA